MAVDIRKPHASFPYEDDTGYGSNIGPSTTLTEDPPGSGLYAFTIND